MTYRVVSADGHLVSAALPITYAPPAVPLTQQSAGAAVIVAGAAAVAIARRRARPSTVIAGG